jgi:hypothetical protein
MEIEKKQTKKEGTEARSTGVEEKKKKKGKKKERWRGHQCRERSGQNTAACHDVS